MPKFPRVGTGNFWMQESMRMILIVLEGKTPQISVHQRILKDMDLRSEASSDPTNG